MKNLLITLVLFNAIFLATKQTGFAQTATAEKPQVEAEMPAEAVQERQAKNQAMPAEIRAGKTRLRVGEGENLFWFKHQADAGCKFYDGTGKELAEFSFKGKSLIAKSPSGVALFEVKRKASKVMILDSKTGKELFKLKLKLAEDKIDFYLPNEKRAYRIKKKDYGWRLEDNAENTLFRAKTKPGKIVLRDTADKTVLYSKEIKRPLPLVFFKIKELSKEQKAACAIFFMTPPKKTNE